MNGPLAIAQDRARGILLISAAFVFFTFLDTSAKYLSQSLPTVEIVAARFLGHFLVALLWLLPSGLARLRSSRPGLQILRSLLLFAATLFNFLALGYLQLSTTSAISFFVPLLVAALAVPVLGERIGPRRWSAILLGFLGVLVIVRPGLGLVHWAVGLSLLCALSGAFYNITTRKLAGFDPPQTTQFYTALIGTALLVPLAPFVWVTPADWVTWAALLAIGVFGGIGHYLLILAHRYAPAAILAPFVYPQILYMTAMGYLVFGDVPESSVLLGAAIVILSGLYLWYRERQLKGTGS